MVVLKIQTVFLYWDDTPCQGENLDLRMNVLGTFIDRRMEKLNLPKAAGRGREELKSLF